MFFSLFQQAKLASLKKQIEKGIAEEKAMLFSKLLKMIHINAVHKDFEANKTLLIQNEASFNSEDIQALKIAIQKEETKILIQYFQQELIAGNNESALSLLADIHARNSEEVYKEYETIALLLTQKNYSIPFSFILSHSLFLTPIYIKKTLRLLRQFFEKQGDKVFHKSSSAYFQKNISESETHAFEATEAVLSKSIESLPEENPVQVQNIFDGKEQKEVDIFDAILFEQQQEEAKKYIPSPSSQIPENTIDTPENDEINSEYAQKLLIWISIAKQATFVGGSTLLLSFAFFFIQFDSENTVLSFFGQENFYVQQERLNSEVQDVNNKILATKNKIIALKQGIINKEEKIALAEIIATRIDWMNLQEQLEIATLSAFPYNKELKYIQYTDFQGDAKKGTITITGNVSNPSGRVFSLITNLIQAINANPYFSGAEINTFAKSKNTDTEIGGYSFPFSLTLVYNNSPKK